MPPAGAIIPYRNVAHVLPLCELFPKVQPVEVDIGCGKGRFLLARATGYPHVNFLGVDRMWCRLMKLDRKVARAGLTNVRLIQLEASYVAEHMLPPLAIAAYHILFPDPWPKRRHHGRRLFKHSFMDSLDRTLIAGGCVHVASDHQGYFRDIRSLFTNDRRFEEIPAFVTGKEERTNFELLFLGQGRQIDRCSFRKAAGA